MYPLSLANEALTDEDIAKMKPMALQSHNNELEELC